MKTLVAEIEQHELQIWVPYSATGNAHEPVISTYDPYI
jgi:hypothetical protein